MKKIVAAIVFLIPAIVSGTHLRGGQITVTKKDGLTCTITLRVFTNTGSVVRFSNGGSGILSFGDGSMLNPPQIENSPLGLGPAYGFVEFSTTHTYPGTGFFIVTYVEHNLDAGIQNIPNSVAASFYMETGISVGASNDYSSPRFATDPILYFPLKRTYAFSTAPIDSSNRFYQYDLSLSASFPAGYQIPESFLLNPKTGLITWDTKSNDNYVAGEYFFFVRITQHNENGSQGYVTRCFQILLEDSDSRLDIINPVADPDGRIVIVKDAKQSFKVILLDSAIADSLRWHVYIQQPLQLSVSFSQYDSASPGRKMRVGLLTIQTDASIVRDYPYPVVLRGTSQGFSKDITFMYFTKDVDFPKIITGLESKKDVHVFPNPFSDCFYVDGLDSTPVLITVLNSLGQLLIQTKIKSGEPVETRQLPAGIYIIQIDLSPIPFRQRARK